MTRASILGMVLAVVLLVLAPRLIPQQHASITLTLTVSHNATLSWTASTSTNVIGYHVQRSTVSGGPYTIIQTTNALTFKDTTVAKGVTYFYVVTAVDVNNLDSVFSNQVSAVIPST